MTDDTASAKARPECNRAKEQQGNKDTRTSILYAVGCGTYTMYTVASTSGTCAVAVHLMQWVGKMISRERTPKLILKRVISATSTSPKTVLKILTLKFENKLSVVSLFTFMMLLSIVDPLYISLSK